MSNPYGIPAGPGRWQRAIDNYRKNPSGANGLTLETRIRTALASCPDGQPPHGYMPRSFLKTAWTYPVSGSRPVGTVVVEYRTCSWFCTAMQAQLRTTNDGWNTDKLRAVIEGENVATTWSPPTREVRCQVCGIHFDAESLIGSPAVVFPRVPDLEEVPDDADDDCEFGEPADEDVRETPKLDALLGVVAPWDSAPDPLKAMHFNLETGELTDPDKTRTLVFATDLELQLFESLSPTQRLVALPLFD